MLVIRNIQHKFQTQTIKTQELPKNKLAYILTLSLKMKGRIFFLQNHSLFYEHLSERNQSQEENAR